jgi:hypothetical protein
MGSASDVWNVSEDSSVEILNNLNSVKNVLQERLNMNFVYMISKALLLQNSEERLMFNKNVII